MTSLGMPDNAPKGRIDGIRFDSNGRLWACSPTCVYCFVFDGDGRVSKVHQRMFTPVGTLNSRCLYDLKNDGSMYICQNGSVSELTCDEQGISDPRPMLFLAEHLVVLDMLVHRGDLWVASDIGLYRCDMQKYSVREPVSPRHRGRDISQLRQCPGRGPQRNIGRGHARWPECV